MKESNGSWFAEIQRKEKRHWEFVEGASGNTIIHALDRLTSRYFLENKSSQEYFEFDGKKVPFRVESEP